MMQSRHWLAVRAASWCLSAFSVQAADGYKLTRKIEIPGTKLASFDIGFVDPEAGRYYLADRSDASVDVIDTKTNTFLFKIGGFVGAKQKTADSGPDGVGVVPETHEVCAGGGDSTLK